MDTTDLAYRCIQILRESKSALVTNEGIGADLMPGLFAYESGEDDMKCIGYAQLRTRSDALARVANAADIMRRGWSTDALCYAQETFVATGPGANLDSLPQRFADGDPTVLETITVLAATEDSMATICQPYRYGVPRLVEWDTPLLMEGGSVLADECSGILHAALRVPKGPRQLAAAIAATQLIADLGFIVRDNMGLGT